MMRVLMVMNLASEYGGNVMACVGTLSSKLSSLGHEVAFLLPETARGRTWVTDLDLYSVDFAEFNGSGFLGALRRIRRSDGQTLVHAHFLNPVQLAEVRLVFPVVVNHFHMTMSPKVGLVGLAKDLVKSAIYRTMVTAAVSPSVADDLRSRLRLSEDQVRCIPNAIDFSAPRMTKSVGTLSDFAGLQENDTFVVGMFGTHYEGKGVDLAALAFEELGEGYLLVVLAHDVDTTCCKIDSLGLSYARVCVLPVTQAVGDFFNSIDLFVSPSHAEAFCYAVVEAAWSFCQVAASLVPGQDYLRAIPHSIWFPPEDPANIAFAVREARQRRAAGLVEVYNADQRSFVERTYSLDTWLESVIALFNHALRMHHLPPIRKGSL